MRIGIAISALALCSALVGCSSADDETAAIAAAVEANVDGVQSAYASLASSGMSPTIWIRVYVDGQAAGVDDPARLAQLIDDTFETVWDSTSQRPSRITMDVIDGTQPAEVTIGPRQGIDLGPAHDVVGLGDTQDRVIIADRGDLIERYGEQDSE